MLNYGIMNVAAPRIYIYIYIHSIYIYARTHTCISVCDCVRARFISLFSLSNRRSMLRLLPKSADFTAGRGFG